MELQPIIMAAGRGSRMMDITYRCPRALLPIANIPAVCYPIAMLERVGFEEALVVVPQEHAHEIQKVINECSHTNMHLDFVPIPDSDSWGTADSLRHIKDKIKTDMLIISCDLVTDVSLHRVVDLHRTHDATLTMLLSPTAHQFSEVPPPGIKAKRILERDLIGMDEKGKRLLFFSSEADLEETVTFKKSFLIKHPCIAMKSDLTDCHLYIIKKWVLNYIANNRETYWILADNGLLFMALRDVAEYGPCQIRMIMMNLFIMRSISSIKSELIPHLVKKQFSKPQRTHDDTNTKSSVVAADMRQDIFSYMEDDEVQEMALERSSWNDHHGDMAPRYHGDRIRCYAYIIEDASVFCARANNLSAYCEINKQIPRHLTTLFPNKTVASVPPTMKGKVGNDCLLDTGVTVGDKASIKRSIIGKHCVLGDDVKIANSVIMHHVTIADGSMISGALIASDAQIGAKSNIKDSIIGAGKSTTPSSKLVNETHIGSERMMEI